MRKKSYLCIKKGEIKKLNQLNRKDMLPEEFYKLTGVNLTGEDYKKVENIYTSCKMEKDVFANVWMEIKDNEIVYQLVNELTENCLKLEDDCRALKGTNESLFQELEGLKAQHAAEMDNERLMHRNHMEDFAKRLIKAGEYDFPKDIYDAVEEEFGIQFIIRSKWEQSIDLTEEEIDYMVKHMK